MQVGGTVKRRADPTGLRLLVMTSVFVLLSGGWLWGIIALGAHATAAQGPASDGGAGPHERAVVLCPALRELEEVGRAAVGGDVCGAESRPHVGTSRQPGPVERRRGTRPGSGPSPSPGGTLTRAGCNPHRPKGQRKCRYRPSPRRASRTARSSQNAPSTHFGA